MVKYLYYSLINSEQMTNSPHYDRMTEWAKTGGICLGLGGASIGYVIGAFAGCELANTILSTYFHNPSTLLKIGVYLPAIVDDAACGIIVFGTLGYALGFGLGGISGMVGDLVETLYDHYMDIRDSKKLEDFFNKVLGKLRDRRL